MKNWSACGVLCLLVGAGCSQPAPTSGETATVTEFLTGNKSYERPRQVGLERILRHDELSTVMAICLNTDEPVVLSRCAKLLRKQDPEAVRQFAEHVVEGGYPLPDGFVEMVRTWRADPDMVFSLLERSLEQEQLSAEDVAFCAWFQPKRLASEFLVRLAHNPKLDLSSRDREYLKDYSKFIGGSGPMPGVFEKE